MTKVILLNPPVYYDSNGNPEVLDVSFPPLGILYLASVLESNGISVKVVDIGAERQSLPKTLSFIKKQKACLVGITAMTPVLQGAVRLAEEIKEKFSSKVQVALGGPHVSADPDIINRFKCFDFGVTGEAEETFLSLVRLVLKGKKVKGIHTGVPVKNLDSIPWPARHLVDMGKYLKKASLISTRGCPFHCYYCSRPAVSDLIRTRSPKDIVDEMESLYDMCGGEYLFQDDSLTINKKHTHEFCREILTRDKKFRWAGYTRVDLVDDELLRLMGKAGCYSLTFGIESGNEKLRTKMIGKTFSNSAVSKIISLCNKYGIQADGFFMFGHPTETSSQVRDTINFILKNNFNIIGVSIATPFPGSKLWGYAVADKVIDIKYIDDFAKGKKGVGYAGVYPVYVPKEQNLAELYEKRREVMRRFYLRPKYILHRLKLDFSSPQKLKQNVVEAINVLIKGSSSRAPYKKQIKNA